MIELDLAYKSHLYTQNKKRIEEQEKQYAYYSGDSDKIKEYLSKALEITYDAEYIAEMQPNYVNLTKKMIDQMAVVYRDPAIRYFQKIDRKENEEGEYDTTGEDELTSIYDKILPDNINSVDKRNHRLSKLSNCSLTYVKIDKKKKKISYVVNPIYKYTIEVDDEGEFERITYPKYLKDKNGKDEFFTVVWTKKEHFLFDEYGNKQPIKDNPKMINAYGDFPFVLNKIEESDDIYGEGQSDLINVNEQINFLLTKLINSDIILGTEGTTLAINLNLAGKGTEDGGLRKVRASRRHPITVENARSSDMHPPSLQHVTTDPHITEIRDYIDWYIKYIASTKGLNPSAVLAQLKDTSDYQKIMDAVDQMEMRKDDLEGCRIYEKERYEKTKLVWNTHAKELNEKEIKDDGYEFKVDFAEIEVHKTPADEQAEFEFQLKYNLTTPAEFLMERNPDLTIEQAQKIINDNKKGNDSLNKKMTRLESLVQGVDASNQLT